MSHRPKGAPEDPPTEILCDSCKKEPLYCTEPVCGNPATYVRHTQFTGMHPYCTNHAKKDPCFPNKTEHTSWEEIPPERIAPKRDIPIKEKTAFVKISGDLLDNPDILPWLKKLETTHTVVICVGGGSDINRALSEQGFIVGEHGPMGRELGTFEGKQLARDVLERNRAKFQHLLDTHNIHARVEIPVLDVGGILCHVNGDTMVRNAYLGFDVLYVLTKTNRVPKKKLQFADLSRVRIEGFRDYREK
ncbi:MAG: hypothetical protein HGA67_03570 [Candidatus Yonathbacteria bacterium]|nr:hypothetical protein [Candidatus Yonathbacteria bacterium]